MRSGFNVCYSKDQSNLHVHRPVSRNYISFNCTLAMQIENALLTNELFHIQNLPSSGRGIIAKCDIAAGTLLLITPGPAVAVIYQEYRKEICTWCFRYDRGRNWPAKFATARHAFCGSSCQTSWLESLGADENRRQIAITAYESLSSSIQKPLGHYDHGDDPPIPTLSDLKQAWEVAEDDAKPIIAARLNPSPTKLDIKNLHKASQLRSHPDIISQHLAAALCSHNQPDRWTAIHDLVPTDRPYDSLPELQWHITAYHHLLALLKTPSLIKCITPSTVSAVPIYGSHNSFDLRSLDDSTSLEAGSEHFGTGIWPEASYWNHSCAPNVRKRRDGRYWQFWAERDVRKGEELCITYLGGEEWELGFRERKARLKGIWGFDCACLRCREDEGMDRE